MFKRYLPAVKSSAVAVLFLLVAAGAAGPIACDEPAIEQPERADPQEPPPYARPPKDAPEE